MAQILVVDDSAAVRNEVSSFLKGNGFDVSVAEDGKDGLNKLKADSAVKLVITDVNMPNMDGITLIQELRKLPSYRHTPMLMLTTESSGDMKTKGRTAGATGWLVKPFNPEQLLATIKKVIA